MKTLPLKAENLMDFWRFLASSYEDAYFGVRNWAGFRQNAEKAQITSQISLLKSHYRKR